MMRKFPRKMKKRVIILPHTYNEHSEMLMLPNPRTGVISPFVLARGQIYEVLEVGSESHSFFLGDNVISNGQLLFLNAFNPLFLVLPLISQRENEYFNLERYFVGTEYEALSNILPMHIVKFGDVSVFYEKTYWCYNETKTIKFLEKKFKQLCEFVSKRGIYSDYIIRQKAFDILRHYLPLKLASKFYSVITNPFPDSFSPVLIKMSQPTEIVSPSSSPKINKLKKRTPKALKGVKSITCYFAPSKTKRV